MGDGLLGVSEMRQSNAEIRRCDGRVWGNRSIAQLVRATGAQRKGLRQMVTCGDEVAPVICRHPQPHARGDRYANVATVVSQA